MEKQKSNKFTNFLNHPIIQGFGFLGVADVITWAVTHLAKLPIWETWLAIVFVTTCVVVILIQVDGWRDKHKKKLSKYSDKEIENTIRAWIDIPIYSIQRKIDPDAFFAFALTDEGGMSVGVTRKTAEPSRLLLGVNVNFPEDMKIKLASLGEPRGGELIRSLRLEMARLGIGFGGIGSPLNQILLAEFVSLDDSLTQLYLLQRILFVRRAMILMSELISQQLDKSIIESVSHKVDFQI